MNLLVISENPNRSSFRERIALYLDTLSENGIQCDVRSLPAGASARRKLFKSAREFDGVLLHKKGLNLFDAFWLRRYSRKVIYNFDDAIMYNPKKPDRFSPAHFMKFRTMAKLADLVITGNSYLADHVRKYNPNVEVWLHGLKVADYACCSERPGDGKIRLVWIGSKSTLRYLEQIKPALEEIGSRFDNVVLRIICDNFFDLENMEVEKHLWSAQTRVADLAAADVGLAPLPDDRFTRGKCTFKILEYAATGLPAIASPVGAHSDYIVNNVNGFLAADNSQWVESMVRLIEDADLRKTMGASARQRVADFDVAVVGKRLCDAVKNCIT
ncbi:MAG: glycosyltransferase [Phycisphaerae bacterium]|nr:glycosyltransferase [Phycisphaerae bacterium]